MADTVKQIVDKIKDANNVLVTVSANPSVDELSAALGITLLLNKLEKHATAIYSGDTPAAIEFLEPHKTFEGTVDSLRDFIIALDKEKADHLRYKLVDDMVKIFITPYRTTISQDDLDFSQGDYNVEMVLAIGVKSEDDLDRALESHGKILHDATVAAISLGDATSLGGIEWADKNASSYSEMMFTLADKLRADKKLIDEQIATAFLTGIVAATDRFSNSSTSATVMTAAAQLMAAGANQQLIASKLQDEQAISPAPEPRSRDDTQSEPASTPKKDKDSDGTIGALTISHRPMGDVEEVTRQVAQKNSQDAVQRAEQELAEHAKARQDDAEQQLAEQLAASAPVAPSALPTVEQLQADIATEAAALPPVEPTMHGAVGGDDWKSQSPREMAEPSMGGTLNATTEQAAEDKRRAIEDDRNKTLLSHGNHTYAAAPAFQTPLNAAAAGQQVEPGVRDIFAENAQTDVTARANSIQPSSAPTAGPAHVPTLAEIDQQNRSPKDDARAAIDAALAGTPEQTAAAPLITPGAMNDLPPLPPLPPMPDFSTLPPLPGQPASQTAEQPTASVPDTLGAMFPPVADAGQPAAPQPPADPGQFRIPGQ